MEIALCAAFVPKKRLPRFSICQLSCSLNGVQMKHRVYSGFRTNYGIIESHLLWLLYYSNYTLNDGRISSEIDANGFCQLKIKIDSQSFEVKKIGVRLVYRQDIEDPYQAMAHCINNSSMLLWGPGCSPSWSWRFSLRNQWSNDEDGRPGLPLVENTPILRNHRQRGSKTRGINGWFCSI